MTDVTVTLVLDRIHAINQTLTGVKTSRYFPENLDSAKFPLLFPLWEHRTRDLTNTGRGRDKSTRLYRLYLIVEAWEGRIPTESAAKDAEALVEQIGNAYLGRPRLDLAGAPLNGVLECAFSEDSGVSPFSQDYELAAITFSLLVTTAKTFTFITS